MNDEKINNYELGITNDDWVEIELSEVCTYSKGKKPNLLESIISENVNVPYINIKAFEKGIFDNYTDGVKCNLCEDDDLLMVWDGARQGYTGKAKKGAVGSTLMKIEPVNGIEKNYLFYFLLSLYTKLNTNPRGVGIPHVEPRILWNSKFVICNSSLQKAIVSKIESLFSDLDNGIANLKKAQEQLKIYRQAVLKKAFEGEFTKEWREKQTNLPTAEELLKKIKEERENNYELQITNWKKAVKEWEKKKSITNGELRITNKKPTKPKAIKELSPLTEDKLIELPKLPDNWNYNYLAYAGELARGKSKHRPRNDKSLFGGDYPFFQTGDVKAQKIIKNYSQTYSEFGLKQSKLWKKGTLCITIAANIAETGFLGIDACFPDSIVGYFSFEKIVDKVYIDYFFQSAKRKISAWAPATAQKNINLTILENLVIPFCSIKEQHQIVQEIETRLSVTDNLEFVIRNSLLKAEALRQSILKKAFEGKLLSKAEIAACKQEKDYEPASVLLEKIKAEKLKKEQEAKKTKAKRKNGK